ncbi:MAG: hypothetical protein LUC86_06750 [Prevotellaceae bacterium]|nr:hypothetical protein [Prevotellaceae bacterium]
MKKGRPIPDAVLELVKEYAEYNMFDTAEFVCRWRGVDVYAPVFKNPEVTYGQPILFLFDGKMAREAMKEEWHDILPRLE